MPRAGTTSNAHAGADGAIGVLICDDVDSLRMLLREVVGLRPGLRAVGEARDGNEAVDEARRLQPDVILLDLSMPHRTGLDALPEIRQVAPDAKIIVVSGFASPAIKGEVIALGASRYVTKGADPETIVAAIEEVWSDGPTDVRKHATHLRTCDALTGSVLLESGSIDTSGNAYVAGSTTQAPA